MTFARRALRSVTMYRPEKAYNGFTLFTPITESPSNTWLIDMQGRFVHRWKLDGWCRTEAELLPTGNLLYCIRRPEQRVANEDLPFLAHELIEADWAGNIVWSYAEPYMDSHDWVRLKSGNTVICKFEPVPKDIAAKVQGGVPGSELKGVMWGYRMQEITPDGKVAWEWVSYEHLDPDLDAICPCEPRMMWPLFNALAELPDGNIMAGSPYTSNIYIIDKTTGDVKWRWGQNIISFPHNPSILDNGNILVLDNGRRRINAPTFMPPDWSRVIEVNPSTNTIEWEYKAENPVDFYTTYMGGCERLPNKNTLICEGAMGRFFEVTLNGELVWEYIVPFYARQPIGSQFGLTNATFRAHRYGADYPGLQGGALDPDRYETWNRLYGPDSLGSWPKP